MKVYTNRTGFSVRIAGFATIQCNRWKYGNTYSNKTRKGNTLQVITCNFHVKIKAGKYSLDQKNKYHPD